jgi:putative membrane protein
MSQMLYAGLFVAIPAPAEQLRRGAELMYYGGDITEMLLAFAMVSTWRAARRNSVTVRHIPGRIRRLV